MHKSQKINRMAIIIAALLTAVCLSACQAKVPPTTCPSALDTDAMDNSATEQEMLSTEAGGYSATEQEMLGTEVSGHLHEGVGITVTYKGRPTNIGCMFYQNGRIFISRTELESAVNKTTNGKDAYLEEIDGYVSMADISLQYDISVSCDAGKNIIHLYDAREVENRGTAGKGEAYIRFEDIMADGAINDGTYYSNASFSSYNLEKLRAIGEYMESRGHRFYIAWIPVYVDPVRGVENNVIKNECLYNADFIYTLDWLRIHGGSIVLHGYTHQQYDTISSIGNEFGEDTEYTVEEMNARMDRAIEIAKTLGYEYDVFEFPHYAVNDDARVLAEDKFNVIYQYDVHYSAQIVAVQKDDKTTHYIPTPADYVYSIYDTTIWERLQSAYANGNLISLFFHPTIDFNYCEIHIEDGVHCWVYNEEKGFLPRILDEVESLGDGYGFTHFSKN